MERMHDVKTLLWATRSCDESGANRRHWMSSGWLRDLMDTDDRGSQILTTFLRA